MNDTVNELLATVIAAFNPATRLEDDAAWTMANRIQARGAPLPEGFVPMDAPEGVRRYVLKLRRPASAPPVDETPIAMSLERATEIYNQRLKRRA